jgi:hypothetical protein
MKKPVFTAAELLHHQQTHGFLSHHVPTSAELLARYRREYAAKRALFDALFSTLDESVAQITVQTVTSRVQLLLPHELLEAALQPVLDKLEKELSVQEQWVLQQAAHVEAGTNECGLDASDEQWAVSTFLAQPVSADNAPSSQAA